MKLKMMKWMRDLFPLNRSITGDGIRKTLMYFEKINPEFKRLKFKSGKKIFDWKIPYEWEIKEAYFKHISGKKFADFKKNNLHIIGYSTPISKTMSKKELLKNIFTSKKRKNAIPYVTSYYKKKWGFCLSENQKKKLPNGKYKVYINSKFIKGHLDLSHAVLKGKSNKEIFFSSYCCHPSMANNELSGPVLLNAILKKIKEKYKKTNYSYRFLLGPETIGSIAYLSKFKKTLKSNVICGFVLSCVGDNRAYSLISSRKENTLADLSLKTVLKNKKNFNQYSFLERGSDERQFCSPGIDLPFAGFSRSKYGKYPEYHTSDDNLKIISEENLQNSLKVFMEIIESFELGVYPKYKFECEPQLGKRGLYPNTSRIGVYTNIKDRMNFLAYSDGKNNLFEIARKLDKPLNILLEEYRLLKKHNLIKSEHV